MADKSFFDNLKDAPILSESMLATIRRMQEEAEKESREAWERSQREAEYYPDCPHCNTRSLLVLPRSPTIRGLRALWWRLLVACDKCGRSCLYDPHPVDD